MVNIFIGSSCEDHCYRLASGRAFDELILQRFNRATWFSQLGDMAPELLSSVNDFGRDDQAERVMCHVSFSTNPTYIDDY